LSLGQGQTWRKEMQCQPQKKTHVSSQIERKGKEKVQDKENKRRSL
jgi:hypothetical protein